MPANVGFRSRTRLTCTVTTVLLTASAVFVAPAAADEPAITARTTPAAASSAATAGGPRAVPSTGGVRLAPTGGGSLSGRVIVVDPGHNGRYLRAVNTRLVPDGRGGRKACNTSGTASTGGYAEHAFTWSVATKLAAQLRARGATVILTRPNDRGVGPCVDERAAIGNRARADLVLSIHADGARARDRGFHIIRSTRMAGGTDVTRRSARLATITRESVSRVTGMPRSNYLGGGTAITPRADIAGLNLSRVPAVMLEAGNMRSAADLRLLRSRSFHTKQANALTQAAVRFLR
ncbi:N-acetylmuramoyl-L-alanine amidase [Piscicoccus intestinalis]|uniref:N-acetylmuramoyl-L-alanine amidase n=1 Tax=Piscicoccus intestinalis TaxID=746033 RepID=UPI000837F756|nr:N-acetylmuramoyl-L-alanine amidase [Piscicoccus intestinalis]